MGSSVYFYYVPYQYDIEAALQSLRQREFLAGRYDPAMRQANPPMWMFEFTFPPDASSPAPGPVHATLGDAFFNNEMGAEGTRSIIDLFQITSEPDSCAASPLAEDDLHAHFGTTKPCREQIKTQLFSPNWTPAAERILTSIDRGQGRYIVLHENGAPSEIFFIGYSFD